jgi:predicted nucleic acid-binding protein
MVQNSELPAPLCSDPADDKFVAAAVAANASHVVSGDKALLKVRKYGDVLIVTPGTFVRSCLK